MTLPRLILALSCFLIASSAFAQQRNTVSVFAVTGGNAGGATIDGAYGASFERRFTDRFSAELSVTSQDAHRFVELVGTTSEPVYATLTTRLYPLDLNVSYQLLTNGRWRPYLGGGMRYVHDTFHVAARHISFVASQTLDPEVSGGIALQFNPTLGLRVDAKQVLGSHRTKVADPEFKASIGLSFSF
ncbi:MAG: outer membrane beta-barrel protein [Thermoanaerobaculia bacterium]